MLTLIKELWIFFFFCVTWRKNEKIVPEGQAVPIAREEGKKGLLRKVDKLAHLVFLAQSLWFLVPFHATPFYEDRSHKLENLSSNLQRRADMSVFPATKVTEAEGRNCKVGGC